jgi:hypothetical protein
LGFISSLPQLAWEKGFDVGVVDDVVVVLLIKKCSFSHTSDFREWEAKKECSFYILPNRGIDKNTN